MSDPSLDEVILKNIANLEGAMQYVYRSMEPKLARAVAETLREEVDGDAWHIVVDKELGGSFWIASHDWRTANSADDNFDVWIDLVLVTPNETEPSTSLGQVCGYANSSYQLQVDADIGMRPRKDILRENDCVHQMRSKGLKLDLRSGKLFIPISIDTDRLIEGFLSDDFSEALEPLAQGLSQILNVKPELDQLRNDILAAQA